MKPSPPTRHDGVDLVERLRARCLHAGLDLVQPFAVRWYNQRVEGALRLAEAEDGSNLGVLVGNTRALWEPFLSALRADPQRLDETDPLDRYVERQLSAAVGELAVDVDVRFGHESGNRRVALQRMAEASGLAYLTESHLSVHAVYGPWIGLRAAISLGVAGPAGPAPRLSHPCQSCQGRCRTAFRRALAATSRDEEGGARGRWQLWLAARDACPTGREWRYGEAQLHYHYRKSRSLLRAAALPQPAG